MLSTWFQTAICWLKLPSILRPDVIVTDISMPIMSGIEAVRRIRASLPGIRFIFLTLHAANAYRREAQSAGPAGYILKLSAREELSQAIHDVLARPA
jgi:two-component system, NarL family, response regulator NreC